MDRKDFIQAGLLTAIGLSSCSTVKNGLKPIQTKTKNVEELYVPALRPTLEEGNIQKIKYSQTGHQFACSEYIYGAKKMGPAPHIHDTLDELMYVIEGAATIMVGDKITRVEAGAWHIRPHGIVHTFWNAEDVPVKFLDIYTNQNFDDFQIEYKAVKKYLNDNKIPRDSKVSYDKLDEVFAKWGIKMFHDQRKPLMEKYGLT